MRWYIYAGGPLREVIYLGGLGGLQMVIKLKVRTKKNLTISRGAISECFHCITIRIFLLSIVSRAVLKKENRFIFVSTMKG